MKIQKSKKSLQLKDLIGLFPWIETGKVLDAGCGDGKLAYTLSEYGFDVDATDVSFDKIEDCYQKYSDSINWFVQDIRKLKIEKNTYSAIFCINVFPFIPDDQRFEVIDKLKKGLKPSGLIIISGFNKYDSSLEANFARDLGSPKPLPTGIIKSNELNNYFEDWEILHDFEGIVKDNHEPVGQHNHGISDIVAKRPDLERKVSNKIDWKNLPYFGVGLGWRSHLKEIIKTTENVDFIEIILDEYLEPDNDEYLFDLVKNYAVIPHSVELSIGSSQGIDKFYLDNIKRVLKRCQSPWWSDHLCFTNSENAKTFSLNPLPLNGKSLDTLYQNIKEVKKTIHKPFLLENVAYYMKSPKSNIEESEFIKHLSIATDTGILLDVANLYGNAKNLGIDPFKFIDNLPKDRIIQVHLAGGRYYKGVLFDTHDSSIFKETWEILKYLLKVTDVKAISIERDDGYDNMFELVNEINTIKKMIGFRV